MDAAQTLIADFRKRGIRLMPDGDSLIVEPASRLSDADRAAIRQYKPLLLVLLTVNETEAAPPATTTIATITTIADTKGIDSGVRAELERTWLEAEPLGWSWLRIWNPNYWPHTRAYPRGLVTVLYPGDRVVEVRADYLVIEQPDGRRQPFPRLDS